MNSIYKSPQGQSKIHSSYEHLLAQMPRNFEQLYVDTTQGKTFVVAAGDIQAPPLFLLHGSLSNAATWLGSMALWSQQYRVYAIDIIGEAGKSAQSRPSIHTAAYSAWLNEVRGALKIERATLVGLSLGGWLALDFATTYPERVAGLVLLSPGGIGPNRNILAWVLPLFLLGPWGVRRAYRKILGPMAQQMSLEGSELGQMLMDITTHVKPRTETLPVFSDAQLGQIHAPVLLILGDKDVTLHAPIVRDRSQKIWPQAQVKCLEQAGHFLGDQDQTILDFLNANLKPRVNR